MSVKYNFQSIIIFPIVSLHFSELIKNRCQVEYIVVSK